MTTFDFDAPLAAQLHERGNSIWEAAHEHPMIADIGAGSLPHDTFRFYFEQNIMYLEEYARSISFIATKAPDDDALNVLERFSRQIVENEIPANHGFLERLGGTLRARSLNEMTPVNYAYTRHLLYTTSQFSPAAGLAAILPCQWSYGEIATRLAAHVPEDKIFADWIALFANTAYDALVLDTVTLLDRLATDEGAGVRELAPYFDWSSRYELAFWQMAYTCGRDNAVPHIELDVSSDRSKMKGTL
jgi:thiaminase/transcriptional activator TenA